MRGNRPGWVMRHRALVALLGLTTILFAAVVGWAAYLNGQLAQVPRIELHLTEADRPPAQPPGGATDPEHGDQHAVNILLAGADAEQGGGPSIAESVAHGSWAAGSFRSDTIMVLHINADRQHAYLVSVPRDTWVDIPGYGMNKINAAFSFGGPSLYVRTLEDFTGIRMDHLAIIDWNGFKDLTTALGGVKVYIPQTVEDSNNGKVWTKGTHSIEGQEALDYVRQRHGLPEGDFDRIKRQQNLMRSLMNKLRSNGTLTNPFRLTGVLKAVTRNLTVDDDFDNGEIRSLALSLRKLTLDDITFVTVPTTGTDRVRDQSIVRVNLRQVRGLFGAVLADELDEYLDEHQADLLGDTDAVS